MYNEYAWNRFMEQIDSIKNIDIPDHFKKQFKTKDEFIYPKDKRFSPLAKRQFQITGNFNIFNSNIDSQRVQHDEKLRTQRKWDKDCKMFLLWTMIRYFQMKGKDQVDPTPEEWDELSYILKLDKHALKARWITLINPKQKSQNWTQEEDQVIMDSMRQRLHKHIWTQIAVKLYELNIGNCARTPKQVRERWINYLNPNLRKDQWLMREDLIILSIVLKKGKKWSYISKKLDGRTENQVKNRYKSLINKIWVDDDIDENEAITIYIKKNQSAMNTMKQGMVGKRGRHKQSKKLSRQQSQKNEKNIVSDDEDVETYLSESLSPVPQKKTLKNVSNQTYIKQKKTPRQHSQNDQIHQESCKLQQDYKDFRDFSNYFNQIVSNHSPFCMPPQQQQPPQGCFQLTSQPQSGLLLFKNQKSNSPLQAYAANECSPFLKRMLKENEQHFLVSPLPHFNNEYSAMNGSALLLEFSPFYLRKDPNKKDDVQKRMIQPTQPEYIENQNPIAFYKQRRQIFQE